MPAYFSNLLPVLVRNWRILDSPVDFNYKFRRKPVFGKNKTIRGILFGLLAGITIGIIQSFAYDNSSLVREISLIDYNLQKSAFLGFTLGFGALSGDLLKSFFKRQFDVIPGKAWIPFDQCDFVIGAFSLSAIIVKVRLEVIAAGVIISVAIHIISNFIGYYLGLTEKKI